METIGRAPARRRHGSDLLLYRTQFTRPSFDQTTVDDWRAAAYVLDQTTFRPASYCILKRRDRGIIHRKSERCALLRRSMRRDPGTWGDTRNFPTQCEVSDNAQNFPHPPQCRD